MSTNNPNTSLLDASKSTVSDKTPAIIQTQPRAIAFAEKNLNPPSPLYVTSDELLIIQCENSVAGQTLKVQIRLLFPDGTLSRTEQVFQITSDRINNVFEIGLQEGFLLSVTFAATSVTSQKGQTFCTANVEYGKVGKGTFQYQLFAGYLTQLIVAGWPTSQPVHSIDGAGAIVSILNGAPAAGADWVVTVPVNTRWKLRAIVASLTTSATVATRDVEIAIKDTLGRVVYVVSAPVTQLASLTDRYTIANIPFNAASFATDVLVPLLADAVLFAGWQILSSTNAMQAADQWTSQVVWVEEWLQSA